MMLAGPLFHLSNTNEAHGMPQKQDFKHHTRLDPLVHLSTQPILLLNLIFSIIYTVEHYHKHVHLAPWWIVMSLTLIVMNAAARGAALRAQDRVIRLEERLRLASLVTPSELIELESLTMRQYTALRFASNAELPDLARRAIREKLTSRQIKEAIVAWRPDYDRV
jgi:hypothetical protein